jgi:PHS family inorganic phosphate transporter-like MFS transporter
MQSIGRIIAFGFADAFLQGQINAHGVNQSDPTSYQYGMRLVIDETWRFVAGFGGVFAAIAIALRLTIPESPRYYTNIAADLREAMAPVQPQPAANGNHGLPMMTNDWTTSQSSTKWMLGVYLYLTRTTAWRQVLVMCVLWFLLDVCFYGTGLDSPSTLNLLWTWSPPPSPLRGNSSLPWENDPENPTESIYHVLYNDGIRAIWISSISPLVGGFIVIGLINYVSRRCLLFWTSLALCIIFFVTGALVWTEFARPGLVSSTVFYALAQFFFNLGPNTVVFVLAAEIFPTMFRGTLYGLAAASGKAGALLIRPFVQIASSRGQNGDPQPLARMLFAFGAVMMTIAFLSSFKDLLPDVQELPGEMFHRLNNEHLEDIAPNPGPGELARPAKGGPHGAGQNGAQGVGIDLDCLDHETGRRV